MPGVLGLASANDAGARRLPSRALLGCKTLLGAQVYELGYGWGPRLMSELRKRWVLFLNRHADVRFEGPVYLAPGFSLYIPGAGSFVVGPNVEFRRGFRAEVADDGKVVIGAHTTFSYYSVIQCSSTIEIGEGCAFGHSSGVFDGSHRFRALDKPLRDQGFDLRPVRIGNECGVMAKTTVLADVGDRSHIGANSVVVKPIPAFSVAVGAPARVIDYFGPEGQGPPEPSGASFSDATG